jgi:hypothetical protein
MSSLLTIGTPACCCAALLALNGWMATRPEPELAPVQVVTWRPQLVEAIPIKPVSIDLNSLRETIERPLFTPTRRPPKQEIVEAPSSQQLEPPVVDAKPAFPEIELKGLLFVRNIRKVLLASPEFPDGRWFGLGDTVLGWDLLLMTPDSVTLGNGDQSKTLNLYGRKDDVTVGLGSAP